MGLFKVAVTSSSFSKSTVLCEGLSRLEIDFVKTPHPGKYSEDALIELIQKNEINGLIVGLEPVSRKVISACPTLKFVSKFGVGLDNLDLEALKQANIPLGWTGGVNKRSVSELVLAFALGHCRNVFASVDKMKQGLWQKEGGRLLSTTQFGIVGLGHVGLDLATLLCSFGAQVFYTDIVDKSTHEKTLSIQYRPYENLVRECDILSFHVPSTQSTRGMFAAAQIEVAKPSLFVINTSRGDIVHFQEVSQAVKLKRIAGYASDVFPVEPYNATEWIDYPNMVFTPHIGGNAHEAVLAMGRSAIEHLKNHITNTRVRQG